MGKQIIINEIINTPSNFIKNINDDNLEVQKMFIDKTLDIKYKTPLNSLVTDLKNNNIWNDVAYMFPLVGDKNTVTYELKNGVDMLEFNGEPNLAIIDNNGIDFNDVNNLYLKTKTKYFMRNVLSYVCLFKEPIHPATNVPRIPMSFIDAGNTYSTQDTTRKFFVTDTGGSQIHAYLNRSTLLDVMEYFFCSYGELGVNSFSGYNTRVTSNTKLFYPPVKTLEFGSYRTYYPIKGYFGGLIILKSQMSTVRKDLILTILNNFRNSVKSLI